MKKGMIVLLLIGILLASPLVLAQEQVQTYSGFDRFIDNVKMFFSSGDNKARLALEIREREVDSAIENFQNQNEKAAIKNLEGAYKKLQVVQEKVSLDVVEEIESSVDVVKDKIEKEEGLSEDFEVYVLEEEKTKLTATLTKEIFEYCKELAKEDFAAMLEEEDCNPDTAIPGLEEELEELRDTQMKLFVELMLEIRSCIDDPGTCNCEANVDAEQKAKCEKMVALALKCEYEEDETSCNELKAMEPKKGDSFAESFVPDFLMDLFREKEYMIGYDINHSCGVPEECWDENDKPECKQYEHLKETNEDWDEYGNFIGSKKECGDEKDRALTMRESIPECFDENDNFLETKCGEITMVENEDGLINYLIGNEINKVIEEFENKSAQHTIDVNGSQQTMDVNGSLGQAVWEVKEEIREINNEIKEWVVDSFDKTLDGDDGLTWVVADKIIEEDSDDGLTREIKTYVAGDGTDNNDVVAGGDGSSGGMAPGTSGGAPRDTSDGDCGEGVVCGGEGDVIAGGTGENVIEGGEGTPGTNEISPAVNSNEGDSGVDNTVDPGPEGIVGVID